jgi:dTDP-4-dehydrorhamnose 3,5-epimerase
VSAQLIVANTPIAGVRTVERITLNDSRGSLARLFCAKELEQAGWQGPVAQINHSRTTVKGTLRGMHYQLPPAAEKKLVICIRGEIFDVAVDLRQGSPTILSHYAARLSAANGRALLIPEGCAHGFQSLCDDVELIYLHTASYTVELEGGVSPFDLRLGISWPLPVAAISQRDVGRTPLSSIFKGISL